MDLLEVIALVLVVADDSYWNACNKCCIIHYTVAHINHLQAQPEICTQLVNSKNETELVVTFEHTITVHIS